MHKLYPRSVFEGTKIEPRLLKFKEYVSEASSDSDSREDIPIFFFY